MYKINRPFKLWEFSVSHNSLLLRSEKQYPDVEYKNNYNPNITIDIEFFGVSNINLPTFFNEIEIVKENDIDLTFSKQLENGLKLYKINKEFYIIAAGCIIGNSNWGSNENRLKNPELIYPKIISNL